MTKVLLDTDTAALAAATATTNAAAASKATPVNADSFPIVNSASSNAIGRVTFTNFKAFLKTYFDSLYATIANPTFTGEIGIGSVNVSETELGILEGATLTTAELNYVDGVTSSIQTQIGNKANAANAALTGVATADRITFKQAKATVSAIGNSGSSQALNADNATIFTCSLTGNTSFTFSNFASGDSIELHAYGDGTQRTPTFPTAKTLYNAATIAYPTGTGELLVFTARHNGTEVVISAAGNYAAFS